MTIILKNNYKLKKMKNLKKLILLFLKNNL